MKKHTLIIVALFLVMAGQAFAQRTDPQLKALIDRVATLRQGEEAAYNTALSQFSSDNAWTIMDEIPRDANECYLIGNKQFKLNTILAQSRGKDVRQETRGDFLNGNDPNFNYSLIERGIKKGQTVTYEMQYREGHQTFVVMPYLPELASQIEVELRRGDDSLGTGTLGSDGNIYLNINRNISKSDKLRLIITNHSNTDMPVVIINHNTREH